VKKKKNGVAKMKRREEVTAKEMTAKRRVASIKLLASSWRRLHHQAKHHRKRVTMFLFVTCLAGC